MARSSSCASRTRSRARCSLRHASFRGADRHQLCRPDLRGRQRAAIFLITTDTFIVYTANIMAILGLRALYFALAALVHRFHYLKYALAVVLIFIGLKGFYSYFFGKFDPYLSLAITLSIIAAGIFYSLWKTKDQKSISPAE